MCIPKPQKPVPQPSGLPTTQAADDLQLTTNELNSGTPSGRLALSTRPRAGNTTAAATAGAVLAGEAPAAPSTGDQGGGTAGDVLTGGRVPGSRQPFFQANPL